MYDEAIERIFHLDLAGQSAIVFTFIRRVQHAVFHVVHRRYFIEPGFVNVAVAWGSRTGAAALSDDSLNIVVDRTFHDRVSVLNLDFVTTTVFR